MIKLVYIGNGRDNRDLPFKYLVVYQGGLTINKVYKGYISENVDPDDFYYIDKNDDGIGHYYHRFLFMSLNEVRNEKIDIVLN